MYGKEKILHSEDSHDCSGGNGESKASVTRADRRKASGGNPPESDGDGQTVETLIDAEVDRITQAAAASIKATLRNTILQTDAYRLRRAKRHDR